MRLTNAKIDFWIKHNFNVLLKGKHGIGKTMRIKERFESAGLQWAYFSAATLDPWVDFIGIPRESTDENGVKFLDLIRPKLFATDKIEAIFIDEYNRAPPKIKNAIMELIQFKSINGKKFNNLRMVWGAINPDDEGYDVEPLDPAQIDRFHVIYDMPYEVDNEYFVNKYGENGRISVVWWKNLDEELKNQISPRRLEYALDMFMVGGDVTDVFPPKVNSHELIDQLDNGMYKEKLHELFIRGNEKESIKWLKKENFYIGTIDLILDSGEYMKFFVPLMTDEKLAVLLNDQPQVAVLFYSTQSYDKFKDIVDPIIEASKNSKDGDGNKSYPILLRWKENSISVKEVNMPSILEAVIAKEDNASALIGSEINRTRVLDILTSGDYGNNNKEILAFLMELVIRSSATYNIIKAIDLIKEFNTGQIKFVIKHLNNYSQCVYVRIDVMTNKLKKIFLEYGIRYV